MKKILITGGAGAIGMHLARKLLHDGNFVYLADNYIRSERDSSVLEIIGHPHCKEIQIELCDESEYVKLPLDIDYLFHLAALNGTQNFYDIPFTVIENSTLPSIYLLKRYRDANLKRFIYAGSSEGYASTVSKFDWPVPTDETVPLCIDDPTNVRWSYAISKVHGELACVAAAHEFGIDMTVVRYHNVYGIRMGDKHIIPDFIERANRGIYELFGFEDTRTFIYVSDAVEATIMCANSPKTINEIVNIGGKEEITMLEVGNKIMKILGRDQEITCHPSPKGSVKRRAPDLTKLENLTGFTSSISIDEGLKIIIDSQS